MLLWMLCAGPRSMFVVDWVVRIECIVPAEETMENGREREREVRGGLGRAGETALRMREADDSTECVSSDGDVVSTPPPSEESLATLVILLCGLTSPKYDGFGARKSSVSTLSGCGYGVGELSAEVAASSATHEFSREVPRL